MHIADCDLTTDIITGEASAEGQGIASTPHGGRLLLWLQRRILGLSRRWLAWANVAWGLYIGLPWLAPVLMAAGARRLARIIYLAYGTVCHQLANRSFFLSGPKLTYTYTELLSHAPGANTWPWLRAFIGTPELGYKVAWSDRMVAMYGGIFLGGMIFGLLRHRLRSPKWWVAVLLCAPLVVDGATHFVSDLSGVGQGFRYQNAWLATLTGHVFPQRFYAGTELGSFNSWMRLITGLVFGWAVVWMVYPVLEAFFRDTRKTLEGRMLRTS